jgi:hypothetical protein
VHSSLTFSPIKGETGKIIGISKTARGITERQRFVDEPEELEFLLRDPMDVLPKVQSLRGLLPICASCKSIRSDEGHWHRVETYVEQHSEATFTHGICPDCVQKLYPEFVRVNAPPKSSSVGISTLYREQPVPFPLSSKS